MKIQMRMLEFFARVLQFNLQKPQSLPAPRIMPAQSYFHGGTFKLDEINYIARSTNRFLQGKTHNYTSLATVIVVGPGDEINAALLRDRIKHYIAGDDVFRPEFLKGIIIQSARKSELQLNLETTTLLREIGSEWLNVDYEPVELPALPPGPYAVQNGEIFQVWRLYSDTSLAFIQSVWPLTGTTGEYTAVPYAGADYRTLGIAVPSRLHLSNSKSLPLDGLRVSIKDIYHLKGVRTSLCNRAYNALYPPQSTTSKTIADLISLGVHVVGKNHLSSFALAEHPTQSVDYEAPFNPRADGYQIAGGSSSGSASAVASYDWLDFSIASDATGSVRIPALANGCFGLRPSTGAVSTEGVVSVYPGFDTPGLLGRDLERFHHFVSHWYGRKTQQKPLVAPKLLYPPDFASSGNVAQTKLIESFIKDLEKSLDTVVERKSIAETWSTSAPVPEKDLNVYLQNAAVDSFYYAAFHAFRDFRKSYERKFNRKPFVIETIRQVWSLGSQPSYEQQQEINKRLSVFKRWFLREYMRGEDQNSILVLPISNVKPNYRDIYPGVKASPSTDLWPTDLSPYIGAPELAIPIGHIDYESRISGRTESLPVVVSLMGPPGSDLALIQLAVNSLQASGRPTKVVAGTARMWEQDSPSNSSHL